jgi:syntenin-1
MAGLYPSIEDLKIDEMAHVQLQAAQQAHADAQQQAIAAQQGYQVMPAQGSLYAGLGLEELMNYGGLDISEGALNQYMPQDVALAMQVAPQRQLPGSQALVSITPKNDVAMQRAEIQQGVRQVVLAKDQAGKLGIAVRSIDKGVFVAFVWTGSAAALGGIRFGDQILLINGESVAGWKDSKALKTLKKADAERVTLAIRDRPWCRTLTVVKDSTNHIGFVFKKSEITAIVKDSSAARNGLLIHHNLVEINGQNVVGMKDPQILQIIAEAPRSVTLTIMPSFVYNHLIKNIGFKRIKEFMDHGIPEF